MCEKLVFQYYVLLLCIHEGAIPPWLQGTLLRNGPGLFSIGNTSYNHWFDGLSLIHSFTFKHGRSVPKQICCILCYLAPLYVYMLKETHMANYSGHNH